jgi:hypothetical protein
MISTANGVSNPETGEGNYFHTSTHTKKEKKLAFRFLPWNLEPSRDEAWYAEEAMKLDDVERNQQYPLNENDAFMLSGALYFDREDSLESSEPRPDGKYAIGVDVATGRGTDYTVGDVIDLSSGRDRVLRAKIEAPASSRPAPLPRQVVQQQAKICVERQGGYGEALIIALRDGTRTFPPTRTSTGTRSSIAATARSPRSTDTRWGRRCAAGLCSTSSSNIDRERLFPWLQARTWTSWARSSTDTNPSPRAQDGCNDDCVMSLGLANEMFRQYGEQPAKRRTWRKKKYQPPPTRAGV